VSDHQPASESFPPFDTDNYTHEEVNSEMFADDVSLDTACELNHLPRVTQKMQRWLDKASWWMKMNRMELNQKKATLMVVSKPAILKKLDPVHLPINGVRIANVTETKVLGVIVDERLSWESHQEKAIHKCQQILWKITHLKCVISET